MLVAGVALLIPSGFGRGLFLGIGASAVVGLPQPRVRAQQSGGEAHALRHHLVPV